MGAILGAGAVEDWHVGCLRRIAEDPGAELVCVAWVSGVARARPGAVLRWAQRRGARSGRGQVDPLLAELPAATWRLPAGTRSPGDDEVAWLRERAPDVLLALGIGRLEGPVLEAAPRGLWSFRHEREWHDAGWPLSVVERLEREPVTYVSLDVLGAEPAADERLRAGWLRTIEDSWRENHDQIVRPLAGWPSQLLRQSVRLPPPPPPERPPVEVSGAGVAALSVRMLAGRLRRLAAGALRHDAWSVGVVASPPAALLDARPPRARWTPRPRGRYLADPFGLDFDGRLHVLLEDFSSRRGKGVISHAEMAADGSLTPPTEVLELPTHASYPYLVRHEDRIHLIPETADAREVALYEATDFPRGWRRRAILLEDVPALDSTVFVHEGRWWLLCTVAEGGQPHLAVHAWHAPDLLGPWAPHPANPLKLDVRSARPAGAPFVHGGVLYRPAQDCARGYGRRVLLNRVDALTPTDFAETPVAVVGPDPAGPYPRGLHTLSGLGPVTLVDGNRGRFDPHAFRAALRRRLGRSIH